MTKQEFLTRLPEGARFPSEQEYEIIDFVYNYHPSIHSLDGKNQIARLYSEFGMRIILDMQETAKRMQEISAEIRSLRARIEELEDERQELSGI